jgi:hypothetical protein
MIKTDKNKFSINIVRHSSLDTFYRHFDDKEGCGLDKAMKEAQRLANETGKKVIVLQSVANVYPDEVLKQDNMKMFGSVTGRFSCKVNNDGMKEVANG